MATNSRRLFVLMAAALLTVSACSADATRVVVTYGDFMEAPDATQEVSVAAGTSVDVYLFSNPTTGFVWEEPEVSHDTVLSLRNRQFVSLRGEQDPSPDSPGQDVWTFEASSPGQSTLTFRYSRPWEGGQKGVWTFTLTVDVV